MSLFLKECRQISRSIIYIVFIGVTVLFYVSQLGNYAGHDIKEAQDQSVYNSNNPLIKPPPNAKTYGSREAEIPEQVMPAVVQTLVHEYSDNQYAAYPLGFYKNVKLNEEEQAQVAAMITEITGVRPDTILVKLQEQMKKQQEAYLSGQEIPDAEADIPIVIAYDLFKAKMADLNDLIGGGSSYDEERLQQYGSVPITYEEKLAEYNDFIRDDKVTGAYARLFCDYMGLVVSLFSIFVPVSFLIKDRKAHMNELLYSRKKSSASFILTRYFALIVMMLLPIVLLSLIPQAQLIGYGMQNDISVDLWAYLKYILAWLLPTLMITTAVGFVLTTLTDTPIAIAVQFLWSYIDISTSISRIYGGDYGAELAIRHNTLGNLQAMKDGLTALAMNRFSYVLFSLVLVVVTILIYELKRKGKLDVYGHLQKIFRNRKGANKADALH